MFWRASFFAFSTISITNAAFGPWATIKVENKIVAPDGFQRSAVLAGGTLPAPVIRGIKGGRFLLNVENSLNDDTMLRGTSIHWHGFFQKGTNYADGPVGVSQCPIAPGHSFLYDFSVPKQAGTFWYHSHYSTQYCDGLRGALIVYDLVDPHRSRYDVDDESTIITLGEWYHLPAPSIIGIPEADSTLINGKGRYTGGPLVDLAVVNVVPGKRYRFRLVSIACDPNYIFSIDNHQLTIIEVDGQNTKPLTVDTIRIFAGQRYSFILKADKAVDNYWIRALPNSGKGDLPTGFNGGVNSAILRYRGAPTVEPKTLQVVGGLDLQEADLRPWNDEPAPGNPYPGGADVNINLDLSVNFETARYLVNGKSYETPTVPVLLQLLSGAQTAQELLPQGSIYTLPKNKVIEITIPGGLPGGPHPFHLHGHSFAVVRSEGAEAPYNYVNPVRRDVVNAGGIGSNITIRFTTDNPGPWFLHCHIEWHLEVGLAVVFAEDPQDTVIVNKPSNAWKQLCPIFDALPAAQTAVQTVTAT